MAKLTPGRAILKWVLAPLGCVLIGYYLVGPRIGKSVGSDSKKPPASNESPTDTQSEPIAPSKPQSRQASPDVDVTVQASNGSDQETSPKPRRQRPRKTEPKPAEVDAQPKIPKPVGTSVPPDEGGSAGSTTAGGQV